MGRILRYRIALLIDLDTVHNIIICRRHDGHSLAAVGSQLIPVESVFPESDAIHCESPYVYRTHRECFYAARYSEQPQLLWLAITDLLVRLTQEQINRLKFQSIAHANSLFTIISIYFLRSPASFSVIEAVIK